MKQKDIEVTIRKKEAMPQLQYAPQPTVMYSPPPSQPVAQVAPASTSATPTPSPSASPHALKPPKSSHAPLKCPMAGTFYRSPGPGEPPFVKVDLLVDYIFIFISCFLAPLYEWTLSLGWRQSKEGASLVHH